MISKQKKKIHHLHISDGEREGKIMKGHDREQQKGIKMIIIMF